MAEQIAQGVKLKKVVTVEKTGLDYIKKKQSNSIKKIEDNGNDTSSKSEVKLDMFAEMRKVQLKKVNKWYFTFKNLFILKLIIILIMVCNFNIL